VAASIWRRARWKAGSSARSPRPAACGSRQGRASLLRAPRTVKHGSGEAETPKNRVPAFDAMALFHRLQEGMGDLYEREDQRRGLDPAAPNLVECDIADRTLTLLCLSRGCGGHFSEELAADVALKAAADLAV
jgi:hypothetical protein